MRYILVKESVICLLDQEHMIFISIRSEEKGNLKEYILIQTITWQAGVTACSQPPVNAY